MHIRHQSFNDEEWGTAPHIESLWACAMGRSVLDSLLLPSIHLFFLLGSTVVMRPFSAPCRRGLSDHDAKQLLAPFPFNVQQADLTPHPHRRNQSLAMFIEEHIRSLNRRGGCGGNSFPACAPTRITSHVRYECLGKVPRKSAPKKCPEEVSRKGTPKKVAVARELRR